MSVAFLTTDLLFLSKVTATARAVGVAIRVVPGSSELIADNACPTADLVILDLGTKGWEIGQTVAAVRQAIPGARIVAYGAHVDHTRLDEAREAGCHDVLTKGQFDRSVGELLATYGRGSSPAPTVANDPGPS